MNSTEPRRHVWTRKRIAAGAVIATVVVIVGANQFAARAVTHRIADRAECSLKADSVDVSLGSRLALPKVITGKIGTVHVQAHGSHRNDLPLEIDAVLHGVTKAGGSGASEVTVVAPYADLIGRAGASASASGGQSASKVKALSGDGTDLQIWTTAAGVAVPVRVNATVSGSGDTITITPHSVTAVGVDMSIEQAKAQMQKTNPGAVGGLEPRTIRLAKVPAGLSITAVRPATDGFTLDFAGNGMKLDGAGCA